MTVGQEKGYAMNATQMRELMNRTPFEPLEVHLNNGTVIHVEDPFSISARGNSAMCIVFDDDGIARFIAYRNIAEVFTKDVNGHRNEQHRRKSQSTGG